MKPLGSSRPGALFLAIGGSMAVTGAGLAAGNTEAVGYVPVWVGLAVAYTALGAVLGAARSLPGFGLAGVALGVAGATAFVVQAAIVAVGVARNPYSHNLWPIEIVLMTAQVSMLGLGVFVGVPIGAALARSGRPPAS